MDINQYIASINKRFKLGNSTEHTFRGDLQNLIEYLVPEIRATNEPKRQKCGAPDYILTKKEIPIGFIEAKDIGDKDLEGAKKTGNKEQFDRYKASLNNLIFTDYIDFYLYREGEFVTKIAIARLEFPSTGGVSEGRGGRIVPLPENFTRFENLIKDFCTHIGQTIKSSKKLAEMMAGKARLLSDVIERALTSDEDNKEDSTLKDQMLAFKQILIHDITPKGFADVYAQTIAYGMFAARYHDPTLPTFGRQEAYELIPKSNPFLKKLFGYIAGLEVDDRIKWIVDDLVNIFLACNVEEMLKTYGKSTKMEDPIIHFYEDFLSEYDSKLRKARGVWYTPAPVVNFIVRAVDDILRTEFDLPQGLADTSKTKIKVEVQGKKIEQEVHKVQILDPATGTGTFLAEVIKQVRKKFEGQQGIWSNYVENHLLPRLIGFELLMASYAMAHLKLDLLLTETGFKPTKNQRFRVYLTNSLEEHHPDTGTLFANWLSTEANEANHIKRDTPVMCIIGNPPYAVSSTNKGEWIQNLIADYKKDLNERNIQPLSDDYIKFIRFGQYFIDKNGSGVMAYISNNSFIDGIIHRQMRKHLLESFDKIYILNLHGNSRTKEICDDGSVDDNVFDIMAGVSINIFIKTGKAKRGELGKVLYSNQQGKRELKYNFLNNNSLYSLNWKILDWTKPNYFFIDKNFEGLKTYEAGFKINELFKLFSNGFTTERDAICLHFSNLELNKIIRDIKELSKDEFRNKHSVDKDGRDWTLETAKKDVSSNKLNFIDALYRPFDYRKSCYTGKTKGFYAFPRPEVLMNFIVGNNIGLIIPKQTKETLGCLVTTKIAGHKSFSSYDKSTVFPLYLYPEINAQQSIGQKTTPVFDHPSKGEFRTPNLNTEIVKQIAEKLGLMFTNEIEESTYTMHCVSIFAPIDILDYIYAVLHSPTYREKYKEFLKIDFPRVPYPKDKDTFWQLVKLGGEIRQIHLLESPTVEKYITQYTVDGSSIITKPFFQNSPPPEGCPQDGVVVFSPLEGCPQDGVVVFSPLDGCLKAEEVDTPEDKIIVIKKKRIELNPILNLPYNPGLKQRAKELRQAGNLPEVLFWMQVTKGGFHKIDFDRQRIIGNYIVDFYVKKLGLVVEIDGKSHIGKEDYDRERKDFLISLGLRVYQIRVEDIMQRLPEVMVALEDYVIEHYGIETSCPAGMFPEENLPPRSSTTPPKEGKFGKVYINDTQYFDNVPEIAWNFYIGGYQPAQKWLKERKGRKLEFEDILHYQKIIVALTETDRLMKEIDKIEIE